MSVDYSVFTGARSLVGVGCVLVNLPLRDQQSYGTSVPSWIKSLLVEIICRRSGQARRRSALLALLISHHFCQGGSWKWIFDTKNCGELWRRGTNIYFGRNRYRVRVIEEALREESGQESRDEAFSKYKPRINA